MFEAHAGVGGAALPVDALLGGATGLRPRGDLRVDRVLRRPARGQGLARQDAQFRFGHVEPAAVPGRKHQLYALGQTARLGGRKRPVKRGVGIQIVADLDQALGLAVARMIRALQCCHGLVPPASHAARRDVSRVRDGFVRLPRARPVPWRCGSGQAVGGRSDAIRTSGTYDPRRDWLGR